MKTKSLPAWAVPELPPIENANTSGQGYCAAHRSHALHAVTVAAGYVYSHSTPFTYASGSRRDIVHCYKARPDEGEEHNVSFSHRSTAQSWGTSVSCASGRKHAGFGAAALAKHLAGKAKRYRLANAGGKRPRNPRAA